MNESAKHHFVLVHGAWHGAWCWEKMVPLLTEAGHNVYTLDLPGLGEDDTPIAEITLDSYVEKVVQVITDVGHPVVLVGHSMGGMVITQAAEMIPDKIDTLVYLAAFLPGNSESVSQYSLEDAESLITQNIQVNEEEGVITLPEHILKECLYGSCTDEDANKAIKRLRPQALGPITTPLRLSDENYGRVRRCYVECSEDKAISPSLQKQMKGNVSLAASAVLNTDHSPFYSCPDELLTTLLEMADK